MRETGLKVDRAGDSDKLMEHTSTFVFPPNPTSKLTHKGGVVCHEQNNVVLRHLAKMYSAHIVLLF